MYENGKKLSSTDNKETSEGLMLKSLLPIEISANEKASYRSVKELNEVLVLAKKEKRIRNIDLTGPFGSGKSSIL